jgi:catechol 2,3-dioxygenase-like lactoylglutathione lyase family enzyme
MAQRSDGPFPDHLLVGGIDHAGITVRSLERSLAFYRDLLGLRVIEISSGEEDVGQIAGIPGARVKAADLDAGDGRIFELLEYVAASADDVLQRPNGPGCPHVALRVRDIAGVLQRLAEAGHHPDGKPTTITGAIAWEGATVVYLRDPDGAIIELIQRPEPGQPDPAMEANGLVAQERSTG